MAVKHVQETLGQFEDWKFFSVLEAKKEDEEIKDKVGNDDDKKLEEEDEKDGLAVIQKLQDNIERFKSAAGDKILKFKEFWEENQQATDGFDEEGSLYKLWDSNYVAGVLNLPDEALTKDELDAAIADVDDDAVGGDDEDTEDKDEDKEDKDTPDFGKDEDEDKEDDKEDDKKEEEDKDEEEDKEDDKEDEKVDENAKPVGEDFPLNEAEELDKEGELPAEDVVTPDEESPEEKEETDAEGFSGFEAPGGEEVEAEDQFAADDEVSVEDGEAVELDGDLDGDGTEEGGMEFGEDGGMNDCFVVYDMNGDRDEVFRTKSPKVIEAFKEFYENTFKAAIKEQIQKFKQAQEEKKAEAERAAKEAIRAEKKGKLDKFMKD